MIGFDWADLIGTLYLRLLPGCMSSWDFVWLLAAISGYLRFLIVICTSRVTVSSQYIPSPATDHADGGGKRGSIAPSNSWLVTMPLPVIWDWVASGAEFPAVGVELS